jgi:hypothetical protein
MPVKYYFTPFCWPVQGPIKINTELVKKKKEQVAEHLYSFFYKYKNKNKNEKKQNIDYFIYYLEIPAFLLK